LTGPDCERRAKRAAITDTEAVDYGYLVAFAEGMYAADQIVPRPAPRIAALGFDVVGHLIAQDVLIPASTAPAGQRKLSLRPPSVFFGFLARVGGEIAPDFRDFVYESAD
jgi:hypothetical protein